MGVNPLSQLAQLFHQLSDPTQKKEKNPENILTENCTICQNEEYIEYDYGIPICQTCYFRRNLFLYGSELKCVSCDIQLRDDNFEAYIGESWCKRCVAVNSRNMVESDGGYVNLLEKDDHMMISKIGNCNSIGISI